VDTIVAFGGKNTHPIVNRPGFTQLKREDFGLLTFGPRLHGYNPSIGRPFFVGGGHDEIVEVAKIALDAQMECEQALEPGRVGSEVEAIGRKVLSRHGLERYFVYAGIHSVGVAEFEPPILAPKSEDVVRPGMVFSIDIPIFLAPWGGLRMEDGFLITDDGCEHISDYRREIIRL
jgi:Xaa-Pro aminopeptidase